MSRLEEKLKELGYRYVDYYCYNKGSIYIYITDDKKNIYRPRCYISIKQRRIQDKSDMQRLKNSIDYYDEQLRIMQKDLEELRKYE